MRSVPPVFPGLIALLLAGCGSDKVVGRYDHASCETIALVSDGLPPPPDAVPAAYQAVPCSQLMPTASASAFSIATLTPQQPSTPAGAPPVLSQPSSDEAMFHRTVVVTVRKEGPFNPADRLESTDVTIVPHNARFESWDAVATAYTTINAGSVQLAQTRGFNESLTAGSPSTAPLSASATVGASQTDARTESFAAQAQAETLTASLSPDGAVLKIHRQGGYGVDLTGNTVIKVDLAYDGSASPGAADAANAMLYQRFAVTSYADARKKPLPIRRLRLVAATEMGLPPGRSVMADVYLTYTLRHVVSGDSTYEEKDDVVREITTGPVHRVATLVSAREAAETGYGILVGKPGRTPRRLDVSLGGVPPVPLCFGTRDEAVTLVGYLKSYPAEDPGELSGARLGVLRPELNPDRPPLTLDERDLDGARIVSRCI